MERKQNNPDEKGLFVQEKQTFYRREMKCEFLTSKTKVSAGHRFVSERENQRLQEKLENDRETKVSRLEFRV